MVRSEYNIGEFLVDSDGEVFIHNGYKNADGYGCLIGIYEGKVLSSTGFRNWCKSIDELRVATDAEKESFMLKVKYTENIRNY